MLLIKVIATFLLSSLLTVVAGEAAVMEDMPMSMKDSRGGSGRGSRPSGSRPSPSYNPPTPSGPSGNYPTPSGNDYPSPFTPSGPSGQHYYPHNHRNRPHSNTNSMVCTGTNSSCTCFQGESRFIPFVVYSAFAASKFWLCAVGRWWVLSYSNEGNCNMDRCTNDCSCSGGRCSMNGCYSNCDCAGGESSQIMLFCCN